VLTRDNTKHLVAIVTALAGLATAVKSCTDSSAQAELVATRKVYSVIASRIAKQDEQIQKLHDDDVELRAYVQGFKEAVQRTETQHREAPQAAPVSRSAPASSSPEPAQTAVATPPPAAGTLPPHRPPHASRAPASDGDGIPDAVRVLPPLPAPKAAPSFQRLPAFDSL